MDKASFLNEVMKVIMETSQYLDRLLLKYSNNYNIYIPYRIGAKEYPAYGYFFSHNEKYILVQEANMWTMESFEHVIFSEVEQLTEDDILETEILIKKQMEEKLVRKGEKYPEKNHMSSLLTVILISRDSIDPTIQKQIKKFHFDKGYKFHMRGFCRGRIAAVSLQDQKIYTCTQARDLKSVLKDIFQDVKDGKEGFQTICEQQGVKPFSQESES